MQSRVKQIVLLLSLLFMSAEAMAEDTLASVLAMAAGQQHVAIEYREVRHLQLLSEPWQATGKMFVSPDAFVIEQVSPQRQLLAANKQRFWLFLPEREIRRTGMLTSPLAIKSFGLFKPLMRGDRDALEKAFDIQFTASEKQWQIELKPKSSSKSLYKRIYVKGNPGQPADQMKAEMEDGDYSEWSFKQQEFDADVEERVKALMDEARGL